MLEVNENEGDVWHRIDGAADAGATVECAVEWARRFDHMQQHTGQHILSRAFVEVARADTRSFHLGDEVVTIDVDHAGPDSELLARVEARANQAVWDDRPIVVHLVTLEEARRFPLRKAPDVEGTVRVVEISDYDWSACGGTHVGRSGEVGQILILGTERYKGGTRVSFVAGGRALRRARESGDLLKRISREFSTGRGGSPERDRASQGRAGASGAQAQAAPQGVARAGGRRPPQGRGGRAARAGRGDVRAGPDGRGAGTARGAPGFARGYRPANSGVRDSPGALFGPTGYNIYGSAPGGHLPPSRRPGRWAGRVGPGDDSEAIGGGRAGGGARRRDGRSREREHRMRMGIGQTGARAAKASAPFPAGSRPGAWPRYPCRSSRVPRTPSSSVKTRSSTSTSAGASSGPSTSTSTTTRGPKPR